MSATMGEAMRQGLSGLGRERWLVAVGLVTALLRRALWLPATSVALIPVFNSFILVALFFVIWRGLNSATMPLMNSLVVSHSESDTRAMAFSVSFLVSNLADALVPVAASMAIEGQLGVIFPVSVLILLPGIVIAYYLGRLAKREDGAANNN